ncbi:MAG: alpha/beta hydrolase [Leptospirales bacterium]|nr:alpha/beta hydrolase [Leptospirales bacterium]
MALPPIDFTRTIVDFCGKATVGTLSTIRDVLSGSLGSAADQMGQLTDKPLVKFTEIQGTFRKAAENLSTANDVTSFGMATAIQAVSEAFDKAGEALNIANEFTHQNLFENVQVGSVTGTSFDSFLRTEIRASYRLDGRDVSASEIYQAFKASGKTQAVVMIPGLFCDETIWTTGDDSIISRFDNLGIYGITIRLHPGLPIAENGRNLLRLLGELFDCGEITPNVIAYSNGGLIFRSCLYYAGIQKKPWARLFRKCLIISPPDGGSYIEKIGFWLGLALKSIPVLGLQMLGWIGHMRSEAMKDLSHGIIREEDRKSLSQVHRYGADLYYGELDEVDAYLAYSLISESNDPVKTWLGDGVCEKRSLEYLRESVYMKKPNPESRIRVLPGKSHFQILGTDGIRKFIEEVFV